ncbi:MAG TPA: translation initiation factor IF-2 [Tangfeifania sp.]|nr:translation initiation factor IF-2 [Tangfeifania sp.]
MAAGKAIRLSKLAREFNVGIHTIVDFLHKKGFEYDTNPNTKVSEEAVELLEKEYKIDLNLKKESEKIILKSHRPKQEVISIDEEEEEDFEEEEEEIPETKEQKVEKEPQKETPEKKKEEPKAEKEKEEEEPPVEKKPASQLKVVGKVDLDAHKKKPKKEEKKEEEIPETKEEKTEKEPAAEKKETPKKEEVKPEEPKTKEEAPKAEEEKSREEKKEDIETEKSQVDEIKVVGKINLDSLNQKTRPTKKSKKEKEKERKERLKQKELAKKERAQAQKESEGEKEETYKSKREKLNGPTVVGKIDLPEKKSKKLQKDTSEAASRKKRRKRIKDSGKIKLEDKQQGSGKPRVEQKLTKQGSKKKKVQLKKEVDDVEVQKQIKNTLARLTSKGKSKGSKYRRDKRAAVSEKKQADFEKTQEDKKMLKVTEFVSVSELANMMDANVNEVISTCMSLGLFVSINQRLDAETLSVVADEFGYKVEFVSADIQESIDDTEEDSEENLESRSPIVTVMGHVDHGKTSLLDYIRSTNVIAGEAGGITQHIGAYHVDMGKGKDITFLDTPGHEAFTAMRARGAQVTDIAIIIVAADDNVMPQTVEAINHASAAGVPIVFAINKIDKPGASPERIKEELANMNYLVEEWGGKYQSHDISAKEGKGIDELLEKVLLEAEMLELTANPNKRATGTIIESSLDRGRGYVATVLVQSGTLKSGDIVLAGQYFGHIKAMFNERNQKIDDAGPAQPAIILGLDGAPQAGDNFHVMENERDARNIANKRQQLAREQGLRTQKHITLDEIGRRIAIGNFQELNLIIKGDVDGSVEALADSLIKLSTEEIQVNVKHKAVGQISESDILLAAASEAIVIGFQVRPSLSARKLAEREQIDIRLYSIIYDAINEIRAAMEGMLSPDIKEEITGTAEVMEVFKITKVGTVAGCIVRDGKIKRNSKVRVIRDGIVIYTGNLGSLKRFKEDVKEVKNGYECGLNIENFNDIKVGDNVEAFEEVEVAKTL